MSGIGNLSPIGLSRYAGNASQSVIPIESISERAANAVNQQDNVDPMAAYMAQWNDANIKNDFLSRSMRLKMLSDVTTEIIRNSR
ncbi:hypothetical protein SGGMMB4_04957 [Sodalis glossinidius str. 'morsitans']|uniref:Type III secretion apparatus n=2 Tax=Sodalis glossinidius TaxID=63612 RepID=Q2NR72_SODGM|nr:hypothetical protein [Sodalis glossinidius]AAS66879.1 PrgI [Sodalis glossinidius]BAE75353.1 type III secretion apparatus [Sodalis glossinidius str. 'morsitans']CRL46378.1 hypothetical protein SGGMMB4_04957 [Sodalis glossinidius str. 'morsitans']